MKGQICVLLFLLCMCLGLCNLSYAWENKKTHPAITDKGVAASIADDYLKMQVGLSNGLSTQLYWDFPEDIKGRIDKGEAEPDKTNRTVLEWIRTGSIIEDEDGRKWPIRPRHHFHDPIRNSGLDNQTDHPNWEDYASSWTGFDFTGTSAQSWMINGAGEKEPTVNYQSWAYAREEFYLSLTSGDKSYREACLAIMFLDLGDVLHLFEDMGVPAHARNDFLFGHYRSWYDHGNDIEKYAERRIISNDGQSPWSGSSPVVFDKLTKYFDADVYLGSYLGDGVLPASTWGLSECSNYQFLSTSTMFGCSGTKYQFPHPAIGHTPPNLFEFVPDGNKVYFNGSNYGVPHLARESYTYYIATGMGYYGPLIDNTNTTDDTKVFEDYANITVPRTINYATGLINYFFRGKLSIAQTGCSDGKIQVTITNKSSNSDVNQILKGGTYTLYWDDSSGNRTAVSDFTVYRPGTEPIPGNEWNSNTQLAYDESTKAVFTPPTSGNVQYVLVYEGTISANPASPDAYDTKQIATGKAQMVCLCQQCSSLWLPNASPYVLKVTFSGLTATSNPCFTQAQLDNINNHPMYFANSASCSGNGCIWSCLGDGWDGMVGVGDAGSGLQVERHTRCDGYTPEFVYFFSSGVAHCETHFINQLEWGGTADISWENLTLEEAMDLFHYQWWPPLGICDDGD